MLTWPVVAALAFGVYGQRLIGMLFVDLNRIGKRASVVLSVLPVAIICAVVAEQAFVSEGRVALDERLFGVAVAGVCAWRRFPIYVSIGAAVTATALLRLWLG